MIIIFTIIVTIYIIFNDNNNIYNKSDNISIDS